MKNQMGITAAFLILFLNIYSFSLFAQSLYEADTAREIALFTGGVGMLGLGFYLNEKITLLTEEQVDQLSRQDVNPLDRISCSNWSSKADQVSDTLRDACVLAPFTLLASNNIRDEAETVGLVYAETILIAAASSVFTKAIITRIRPVVYNPDLPQHYKITSRNARKSFFSGHTSMSFATCLFLVKVYEDYHPDSDWIPAIWGGAVGIPTTVGLLRIISGWHFPTDVLVGALVGTLIGYVILSLHDKNNRKNNHPEQFRLGLNIYLQP